MIDFSKPQRRPSWHEYFLGITEAVATRADCRRRLVGAVVVDETHRIIGTGYNGVREGVDGCLAGNCPRGLLPYDQVAEFTDYNDSTKPGYCISTHAEESAILQAGLAAKGCTIYVNYRPCPGCLKKIENAGIKTLVFPYGAKIKVLNWEGLNTWA